jgi:hypothetical protein
LESKGKVPFTYLENERHLKPAWALVARVDELGTIPF